MERGFSLTPIKESKTDPESGWFHKGEHKEVFAYSAETACDKNGWILGYTIHPGNEHDSQTFPAIYEKIKSDELETVVADAGYKTPAIAKLLIDDGIIPVFPYKRPYTKEGFFKKDHVVLTPLGKRVYDDIKKLAQKDGITISEPLEKITRGKAYGKGQTVGTMYIKYSYRYK